MSAPNFFSYFGSKHRLARRYPPPRHDTIVEPFAGSAGYARRHYNRKVVLVEKSAALAACWRYLIGASVSEVMRLPDLKEGMSTADLDVCLGVRTLIGLNIQAALGRPAKHSSSWGSDWNAVQRARIAGGLARIRHWQIIEGDYTLAPDVEATWFVDPPYEVEGYQYDGQCQAKHLDFAALSSWCRSRRGQVIVCENEGAEWLPFKRFARQVGGHKTSREVIWTNDAPQTQASA